MTQNSVLSQNWVRCIRCTPMAQVARTLRIGPVVSWRTKRRVAGLPQPYRGLPVGRVAGRVERCAAGREPAGAAAGRVIASSTVSLASRPYRGASSIVSRHYIATHPVARPSFFHDTNDCIVTHFTSQATCARTATPPCVRPAVSWPIQAVSRLLVRPGHAFPALCHNTIPYIVTQYRQVGSSPSSFVSTLFFFTHVFFPFDLLEDHQIFFFISIRTKNIYFKFFFVFFPVLHTVKPQKNFPQHFFFFHLQ